MSKKIKKVSTKFAKYQFNFIGFALILYILFVLFLPMILKKYFDVCFPNFKSNEYLAIGILYAFILIGTFVPFVLIKAVSSIKIKDFWRKCKISFKDLFIQAIVFCAIGTFLMFVTSVINSYLNIGRSMVASIGVSLPETYLANPMYFFLFVLATPVVEEIAYRGVLLRALGRYGNAFAMFSCSIIFALMHHTISEMITSFILSIILIKITLRYRSVQPAIIIHIIFNLVIYLLGIVPVNYYYISSFIILVIYFLSAFFVITRKIRFVKIKARSNDKYVYRLFYSRFSIIIAIILMITHSIVAVFFF